MSVLSIVYGLKSCRVDSRLKLPLQKLQQT